MSAEPAIKTAQVRKSYGVLPVLQGIDLQVGAGEIVAIVGASGAGKTTLLNILGTLDRADSGEVWIDGKSTAKLSDSELDRFRNRHIGFVFQSHHLLPEFTALENVMMPGMIAGREEAELRSKAAELLKELGLEYRVGHKPAQLSGGEQQRVAVARALINQPAIVLADEPSGNLDTDNSRDLHQLFFDLRERFGQTFVIVTHNPELADMTDRKLSMVDGQIVDSGVQVQAT
jgi:lipoprotein-releasing system ATP-binding protein